MSQIASNVQFGEGHRVEPNVKTRNRASPQPQVSRSTLNAGSKLLLEPNRFEFTQFEWRDSGLKLCARICAARPQAGLDIRVPAALARARFPRAGVTADRHAHLPECRELARTFILCGCALFTNFSFELLL